MGPFELVIHVVQCRHGGEQWKRRNGRRQTKEIAILNDVSSLLVFYISASLTLQHGGFVPRD